MKNIVKEITQYNMKTVYTCSSVYNVLLAVYIVLILQDYENAYIVMFSPEKKILNAFYAFSVKMEKLGIKNIVINKHTKFHRMIGLSDIANNIALKRVLSELNVKKNDFLLVNFSWNQRMVRYPASIYLRCCKEAIFIEEGATQWITPDEKVWYRFLKKVYGNQTEFWKINKVKSIYVQQPTKFPDYLSHKLVDFKIDKCFEKVKEDTKDMLLEIFSDSKSGEEIRQIEQLNGIIFTQPISEDGFVTEKEKIRIYTKLARFYLQYGTIALKIHPRDTTDYQIENVHIIKGSYPSELLSILGIRFKFAIGLCTSAIETVDADIKINLNEKFLSELKFELQEIEL